MTIRWRKSVATFTPANGRQTWRVIPGTISVILPARLRHRAMRVAQEPRGLPCIVVPPPKVSAHAGIPGVYGAVRRNGLALATGFLVVFVPAAVWLAVAPPRYRAELRLLVQGEGPRAQGAGSKKPVTAAQVRSEMELLKSHELLDQVVRRGPFLGSGVQEPEVEIAQAVRGLEQDLEVEAVSGSNVIALRYAGPSVRQATGVLNSLAALYLEKRASLDRNGDKLEFFQKQAAGQAAELDAAQKAMAEFAATHQVSLLQQQKESALRRGEDLEKELMAVTAELQATRQRLGILRTQGERLPSTVTASSHRAVNQAFVEKLRSQLVDLENSRTELLTRYEPTYRLVAEIEKKIDDTRAALNDEQRTMVVDETQLLNPIRQSVEAEYFRAETELRGLEGRQRALSQRLGEQRRQQAALESVTAEYEMLQRNLRLAEQNYIRYEQRKEDARLANALDVEQLLNVSIVEPAREAALPVEGNSAMFLMLTLLAASCTGVSAAVVRDHQTRRVAGAADIANLTGLPVLSATTELPRK